MEQFSFVSATSEAQAAAAAARSAKAQMGATVRYIAGGTNLVDLLKLDVERPKQVRVRYLDRDGKVCEMEADGLLATAVQHEIDHLNGVLFIDHLSRLKRERVIKKFTKAARQRSEA